MLRVVALQFVIFSWLIANSASSKIISIDKEYATIESVEILKGTSAIVVREFNNHKIIVSYAVAISNNRIKLKEYTNLKQDSFPKPISKPKIGDSVMFGFYDQRSMIIAPNKTIYDRLKSTTDKELIHPDLLAVHLNNNGVVNPTKKDFNYMCNEYSIGTLEFVVLDNIYSVDCLSFNILKTTSLKVTNKETRLPFYSRLDEIKKNLFNFSEDIKNYDEYYKKLLDIR